jgi:hypothetical protein
LDLLRKEYHITDDSNDSIDGNGDAVAKPYWDEKRKCIQMLEFHKLLAVKIEAEKLDQQIPRNQNGAN